MDRIYYFMRKNEPLMMLTIDKYGHIVSYSKDFRREELLPLHETKAADWFVKWWNRRSTPISQAGIRKFLIENGYLEPSEYLTDNLGLSLTDYYWIKPVDSNLMWETVSLFSNEFKPNNIIIQGIRKKDDNIPHYSPNSSLQGDIEKTWSIINGERYLIKGNRGVASTQSLNEVFASEIYCRQGYDNYTQYKLLQIEGKEYDYGCCSRNFASETVEFISAYDIVNSEKCPSDMSMYEHFIHVCEKNGIDKNLLRADLETQTMVDYILSGHDRHLNNLGILRDAETLQFIRLAPVFDSGEAFFTGRSFPETDKDWISIQINSFVTMEKNMISKVTDYGRIDISKLPSSDFAREFYNKDTKVSDRVTDSIVKCYERKIEMLSDIQRGKNPYRTKYQVPDFEQVMQNAQTNGQAKAREVKNDKRSTPDKDGLTHDR